MDKNGKVGPLVNLGRRVGLHRHLWSGSPSNAPAYGQSAKLLTSSRFFVTECDFRFGSNSAENSTSALSPLFHNNGHRRLRSRHRASVPYDQTVNQPKRKHPGLAVLQVSTPCGWRDLRAATRGADGILSLDNSDVTGTAAHDPRLSHGDGRLRPLWECRGAGQGEDPMLRDAINP